MIKRDPAPSEKSNERSNPIRGWRCHEPSRRPTSNLAWHPMKNPRLQAWIPALASLVSAGSVVLLFFMPLDTIRIQQLPEARNGMLYCFRKREEMIFLSINRGGGLSLEGRAIAERELPELLSVIRKKSGGGPISLRVSLDPGAPARAVRIAYESGVAAGVSTMVFAVRLPPGDA